MVKPSREHKALFLRRGGRLTCHKMLELTASLWPWVYIIYCCLFSFESKRSVGSSFHMLVYDVYMYIWREVTLTHENTSHNISRGITAVATFWFNILLMEEILHHMRCIKPYRYWDKLPINSSRIPSINGTATIKADFFKDSRQANEPCQFLFIGFIAFFSTKLFKRPPKFRGESFFFAWKDVQTYFTKIPSIPTLWDWIVKIPFLGNTSPKLLRSTRWMFLWGDVYPLSTRASLARLWGRDGDQSTIAYL